MMTTTMPDVADTARFGVVAAARQLGVCKCTMIKYIKCGFVRHSVSRLNGRKYVTGKELKRAWKVLTA